MSNSPFESYSDPYRKSDPYSDYGDPDRSHGTSPGEPIEAEVVYPEAPATEAARPAPRRRSQAGIIIPMVLFVLTCVSTFSVAGGYENPIRGLQFSFCLMAILLSHEMGHFLQAFRYGAPATLPIFLPVPFPPFGTFGAVIAMDTRRLDRRALFDIGITGPLAGLVPALLFTVVGIHQSDVVSIQRGLGGMELGEPLLFTWLTELVHGPLPEGFTLLLGPMAYAGWVGLLITSLNLIPIGQLDGGHVLYALLGKNANKIGSLLLLGAVVAVVLYGYWSWLLMIFLLAILGPEHPPTADDRAPLGPLRIILGWLVLAFIIIGFTPEPFKM